MTGSHITFTFHELTRKVAILHSEEIKKLPVYSIPELFDYLLIDTQTRSTYGIQSDISIRGSTFQQVAILIDGVRFNDIQTAHHNTDIPINLDDIEKIEILYGQGSSIYGTDAFGGVINIITKKPKKEISGKISFATYNTKIANAYVGTKFIKLSIDKGTSDGWMYDTEFDNTTINAKCGDDKLNLSFGFGDKKFGAFDFYTPGGGYPSYELTQSYYIKFHGEYRNAKSNIFFKKHWDKFILKRTKPSFYINEHTKETYGGDICFYPGKSGLAIGGETYLDTIISTNLGNHKIYRNAIFAEYKKTINPKINSNFGIRYDILYKKLLPNLDICYWINTNSKLYTSIGKAFRIPSFTELYYKDPKNIGNPNLFPEECISGEIGINSIIKNIYFNFDVFARYSYNLIDWVGETEKGPWFCKNIGKITFYGLENSITYTTKMELFQKISISHHYIRHKKYKDYISKYVLRYPTQQLSFNIIGKFLSANITYKQRKDENGYFVLKTKIYENIRNVIISIEGKNLLNIEYNDILGVPQPKRTITFALSTKIY